MVIFQYIREWQRVIVSHRDGVFLHSASGAETTNKNKNRLPTLLSDCIQTLKMTLNKVILNIRIIYKRFNVVRYT